MKIIYGGFFMKNVDLSVNNRTGSGNKQSRKLRQEDSIPAILYEKGSGGRLPSGSSVCAS